MCPKYSYRAGCTELSIWGDQDSLFTYPQEQENHNTEMCIGWVDGWVDGQMMVEFLALNII